MLNILGNKKRERLWQSFPFFIKNVLTASQQLIRNLIFFEVSEGMVDKLVN